MNEEQEWVRELLAGCTTRRRALELILGVAAGTVGAGALSAAGSPAPQKMLVGKLTDLPPGKALRVTYMEQPTVVFNSGGKLGAFSAICTHEGCPVTWNSDRNVLLCPCHGGVFDTEGQVVEGPPPAPLLGFRVVVEDGLIYLDGYRGEKD